MCHRFPKGLIYFKVTETENFTKHLAEELNMKIAPSNLLDIALSYFSPIYTLYYSLEDDQKKAFDTIVGVLRQAANGYQITTGRTPTLFLDGADLLAKNEKDLFSHILMQAKILANKGVLTIVFVSSKGSVVPVIQQTSGVSRCNRFSEVEDVDDNEAIKYLIKKGFSKELSEMFVDYVGGRCVYLHCRFIVVITWTPFE